MFGIAMIALLDRREVRATRVVAAAAIVIVITNPVSTFEPGFRLSFGAVLILAWLARRKPGVRKGLKIAAGRWIAGLLVLQVGLLLGLAPLTALQFQRVSFASVPANMIAVPVFSFVTVPLALLGLAIPGPLADVALEAAAASVELLDHLIVLIAAWPGAFAHIARVEAAAWLLVLLPVAWSLAPPGWPGRHVGFVALAALVLWRPAGPAAGCIRVWSLDVGQGLAVVIEGKAGTLLYDTGPAYYGGGSAAERVVLPFLRSRGIERLDTLVVSHGDLDHAGGLPTVDAQTDIGRLLAGHRLRGAESEACRAGMSWSWPDARFSVLHPATTEPLTSNDASCVLLAEVGTRRVLLTGDIEANVEAQLVRSRMLPPVDVVMVPHHGSRTSSTAPFARALEPEIAVVSAAWRNRWGFPKADVVARWQATGAQVLNTATSGTIGIVLCSDGSEMSVVEWRQEQRRMWRGSDS
jgi:competence protein ComEC